MLPPNADRPGELLSAPNPPLALQPGEMSFSLFVGPLPEPDTLRNYDEIVPGYAKKLAALHLRTAKQSLDIQQSEVTHRQQLERDEQATISRDVMAQRGIERSGKQVGAVVAIVALALCGWVAWLGHPAAATAIGLSVPVGLLTAFIFGRYKQSDSSPPKQPAPPGAATASPSIPTHGP